MWTIILIISILVWALSRGCTEGYKWATDERCENNRFVCGRFETNPHAFLDYHSWRYVEAITYIVGLLVASKFELSLWLFLTIFGTYLFSIYAIYERVLNKIVYDKYWYPQKGDFYIFGFNIKNSSARERFFIVLGLVLALIGILKGL
jgi:hypothetical protein